MLFPGSSVCLFVFNHFYSLHGNVFRHEIHGILLRFKGVCYSGFMVISPRNQVKVPICFHSCHFPTIVRQTCLLTSPTIVFISSENWNRTHSDPFLVSQDFSIELVFWFTALYSVLSTHHQDGVAVTKIIDITLQQTTVFIRWTIITMRSWKRPHPPSWCIISSGLLLFCSFASVDILKVSVDSLWNLTE